MRNPTQSFPVSTIAGDADLAREIVALTATSLRWAGKGPRVIARAVATALDAALRPACVSVTLIDRQNNEKAVAIDGELNRAGVDAEQWRSLLQSESERPRVVSHPTQPGKLYLLRAPVGSGGAAGEIVIASADPAFPTPREELLLQAASHQTALALAAGQVDPTDSVTSGDADFQAERLRVTYEQAPMGIAEADLSGRLVKLNDRYCEILGYAREDLVGRHIVETIHPDDVAVDVDKFTALARGDIDSYDREKRYVRKDGGVIWGRVAVRLIRNAQGEPRYVVGILEDISARHRAEERARFLAEASRRLAASLDYQETLEFVVRLAVPSIADWCAIDLIDADGQLVRLATAYRDAQLSDQATEYRNRYPLDPNSARGPYAAVRNRRTELISEFSDETLISVANTPEQGQALRTLGVNSYICTPLIARERALGTVTLVNVGSSPRFAEVDREFVEELARRIAVAIDNALLFQATRTQAERLQATYNRAPIGIAEQSLDGRFVGVNDRFCDITGYPRAELLAGRGSDITHGDDIAADAEQWTELASGARDSYQCDKRYVRPDGAHVWVNETVSLVRDGAGRPSYGVRIAEDITERRRAEVVITGQKKALEQMARGERLTSVLETLVEIFDRQSPAGGFAMVLRLDADGRRLRPAAVGRLPAQWIDAIKEVPVGEAVGSCGAAAFHGEAVYVEDIATDDRWVSYRDLALTLGFRAAWSICLRSSAHEVLGTFAILYREPRAPNEAELRFLDLIADTAAVAIERYRDEERLTAQAQMLSRIHDAVIMFDLDGNILRWNEGAERLFGFPENDAVGRHIGMLCGTPEQYAWLKEKLFDPVKRDGRLERVAQLRRRSGDMLYAHVSLSLLNDDQGQPASMVAYVLDVTARIDAENELNARVHQQDAVARLGQMALSAAVLQELLDRAAEIVAETLDVEFCEVLERLPEENSLLLRAGVGWREGLVGHRTISADSRSSQAGYTLGCAEPVIVPDLATEARFKDETLPAEHSVASGMTIVIPGSPGRAYGVLGAHSKRPRRFSDNDVSFLQAVANVLASAIQRMRFEEAMRDAHEDLEQRVEERTAELARANQSLRDEVVDRMGVESALRDSEAQYRMLFERNPLPAWVFDIHTRRILAANETAVWQYGYTRDEFLCMTINELHPPEEAARVLDYAGQFPPETAYIGAWKHKKQDETIIDVEVFVYEVLFQGRWARLMLANDITERRRTEQEFRLMETITRSVSEADDADSALYAVLRSVCEATGWVLGEAWLPSPDGRIRCTPAWYRGAEGLDDFRAASWERELDTGEGLIGRAWESRQPIWLSDVTSEDSFLRAREAAAAGLRAGIAFPVSTGNDVVAVVAFFLREPRVEDEHQVKLVSTIAAQVAIAIQRKRAEERLRESEERFRLLVEGAHDYAIYMLDSEGRIASWNRGAERLKGYAADEVVGRHVSVFYAPEDIARQVPQRVLGHAATEGVFEAEGWRVRKGGERFWANVTVTALRDSSGALRGFVKVTRDVSERKRAEERLKQSETRLARAQEFSLLMVAHTGLDGRWLKVPPLLCATLAYREEELLAASVADVTHADDFATEWRQFERLAKGEAKSFDLEKRFLRRDGKVIWVYQNTSVVLDADDRPLHFLTYIRDITEKKEAEEELRRREIQLSEAQRLAHLGSWEWDVASGRLEWSEELYRIYDMTPRVPLTYEAYLERVHPEDRARVHETVQAALAGRQPFVLEERIVRADGELRHLLSHGAVVADRSGDSTRMIGVCLDITERKRSEERLRDYTHRLQNLSQRLLEAQETERRRIARELHDQIGQDLSVIKINLQSLSRLPPADTRAHIDETIRVVEGVLMTARNLSVELRPSMLDDLGLVAALRWYLDRQAQRGGVRLHFVADALERLNPTIETACFRLAQEALTNVLRHAGARNVEVTLAHSNHRLEMRIIDDGRGFDVEEARARAARGESFGLLGMEERALLAGGQLEIISGAGTGTSIIARFQTTQTPGVTNERN